METQDLITQEINNLLSNIESKSWICNYLKTKKIIDDKEFMVLSRFGAWVSEQYPNIIKGYWTYLDKLMQKYDKIENIDIQINYLDHG